jgi:hypothetical protein
MIPRIAALIMLASSLPLLAQGGTEPTHPHQRCLTPLLVERELAPEKLTRQQLAVLNQFCQGPSEANGRPIKQRNVVSTGRHFRIHFDTDGINAVAARDLNGNSVPDYIDSVDFYLEYAWEYEVGILGYAAPPPENHGPGPEIDVYVCNLSNSYYGGAQPEDDNRVGDNPFRLHGYLLLDNDYVDYPTSGIAALRVTTAHELHHIIQFASYRTALGGNGGVAQYSLYESTSTWMEEEVHPDVDDWYQYVAELIRNPQKYGYSTHNVGDFTTGYGHMLYMEYLEKRFGRDVIREIWDEFRLRETFDAIDVVLKRRDFNLSRSYCEFAEWSYYTGHRSRDTALLKQAPQLPALGTAVSTVLDQSEAAFEDELYPLSFGLYRLLVPTPNVNIRDTVDFLVTNSRSDIGAGGPSIDKEPFRIEVSRTGGPDFIPHPRADETLYYRIVPLSSSSVDVFCLDVIDDSVRQYLAIRTSPQPFINTEGEDLLFGIGATGEEVRNVKVWILTAGLTRVIEFEQAGLKSRDNQLGVLWNGRDRFGNRVPTGVYIYEISINGGAPVLGKFAVVRE